MIVYLVFLLCFNVFALIFKVKKRITPCKRIRNPANFCCWNPESRGLECGIHNGLESGIHYSMESGIHYDPESWNPVSRGQDPESRTFMDSLTWGEKKMSKNLFATKLKVSSVSGCHKGIYFGCRTKVISAAKSMLLFNQVCFLPPTDKQVCALVSGHRACILQ